MLFRNSPHPLGSIFQLCGKSNMSVLGTLNYPDPQLPFDPGNLFVYTFTDNKLPQIYCPAAARVSVQIIVYDVPSPERMQYLSVRPISLALTESESRHDQASTRLDPVYAEEEEERVRV